MDQKWVGNKWDIQVLYSKAGVATQIFITTQETDFLVDVGDGILRDLKVVRNLKGLSGDLSRLKAVLITHGHFDHVGGIFSFLSSLVMYGRTKPIKFIIPKGAENIKGLIEFFKVNRTEKIPFEITVSELGDKEKFHINGIEIEALSVIHRNSTEIRPIGDIIPANGYSLRYNNQKVVITGDTGICSSIENVIKDADLAIIEATFKNKKEGIEEIHLCLEEAIKLGKKAKDYILIHQ